MRMKAALRYILSAVMGGLLLASSVPAQPVPELKQSDRIHTGTLRCGIPYYLAVGNAEPGLIDAAFICDTAAVGNARGLLEDLPHFAKEQRSPWQFLSAHGAGAGPRGYISESNGSAVFTFEGLRATDAGVRDSTLLLLMDLAQATPGGNHAFILAGDLDPATVRRELDLLSLMLPSGDAQHFSDSYVWVPTDSALFVRLPEGPVASVEARYRMPRVPKEVLNTFQPYISSLYAHTLGLILYRRLRTACLYEHIPYGNIDYSFRSSAESDKDEQFSIRITTDAQNVDRVVELLGKTLASIDRKGVLTGEYADTKQEMHDFVQKSASKSPNSALLRQCMASVLYGTNLASAKEVATFLTTRSMAPERETQLFNSYASALLDSAANLTLLVSGGSDPDPLGRFTRSWASEDNYVYSYIKNKSDSRNLSVEPVKTKLKKSAADPISGGEFWTFANGTRVVFKRTTSEFGRFHYGWVLRGGYPEIPDLSDGEGPFIGDMLRLSYIGSMKGIDFFNMLHANDISLEPSVSIQDLRMTGRAPSEELELLIRSLLEIALCRKPDPTALDTYCENQRIKIAAGEDAAAPMWDVLYPDYRYRSWKEAGGLDDDSLSVKANRYFDSRFARHSEGMLVLIGDLDPGKTQRLLSRYLGALPAAPTQPEYPARIDYQPRSGALTLLRAAQSPEDEGCTLLAEIPLLYTAANVRTLQLAGLWLSDCLDQVLTAYGLHASFEPGFTGYPEGRFHVLIRVHSLPEDSLPASISPVDPAAAAIAVRHAIAYASKTPVPADRLAAYKRLIEQQLTSELASEASLVDAVLTRCAEGKDMISNYKRYISAVTAQDIQTILTALNDGARVEYIRQ